MRFRNNMPDPGIHQQDPFRSRRLQGLRRPAQPLPAGLPNFRQDFSREDITVSWLGHSSVFLHIGGKTLLIDPVFSRCLSPIGILGPKRFPGRICVPSDFPRLDAILITHNHYDHMDIPTLRALDGQTAAYVVPKGLAGILTRHGIAAEKIQEMGWNDAADLSGLRIACTPAYHNSRRSPWDTNRTLWCSFVLQPMAAACLSAGIPLFPNTLRRFTMPLGIWIWLLRNADNTVNTGITCICSRRSPWKPAGSCVRVWRFPSIGVRMSCPGMPGMSRPGALQSGQRKWA